MKFCELAHSGNTNWNSRGPRIGRGRCRFEFAFYLRLAITQEIRVVLRYFHLRMYDQIDTLHAYWFCGDERAIHGGMDQFGVQRSSIDIFTGQYSGFDSRTTLSAELLCKKPEPVCRFFEIRTEEILTLDPAFWAQHPRWLSRDSQSIFDPNNSRSASPHAKLPTSVCFQPSLGHLKSSRARDRPPPLFYHWASDLFRGSKIDSIRRL